MEDHNQSWKKSKSEDKESILELSTEMESPDQTKHKIIDLTLEMDSSQDKTESLPEKEKVKENQDETPESAEADSPEAIVDESAESIEDEVNAAFDEAQMQPQESTETQADDELFDELSDITQQVDDAISQLEPDTSQDESPLPDIESEALDDDNVAADAAELDAAMAGEYEDTPSTPSDTALDEADEFDDTLMVPEEDGVIELVDVVDATELEALDSASTEDEDKDIIELTEIVDPLEAESLGIGIQTIEQEVPQPEDLPDATDATAPGDTPDSDDVAASEIPVEEELSLSEDEVKEGLALPETNTEELALLETDLDEDLNLEELSQSDDEAEEELALPETDLGEEFTLSEADDDLDFSMDQDEETAIEEDPFDPVEIDNLFGDDLAQDDAQVNFEHQAEDTATDIDSAREDNDHQEQVIQLSDILRNSGEQPSSAPTMQLDETPETNHQLSAMDSQDESGGLDSDPDQTADIAPATDTDTQIEAAVEHVIQTKYADTIEKLIANEVEKAVTREIENLKRTLSGGDDEPDT